MGWRRFLRRGWWDDERARELQSYVDLETDENIAHGMAPDDARAAALRKLGNPTSLREEIYAMNTIGVLDRLWQDIRYGTRVLARSPGFTVAAVMTLALGIGGVTVIYSVIRNVLLDPFPYTDSTRMVDVLVLDTATERIRGAMNADEFLDYRDQSDVFDGVIATISAEPMMMPRRDGAAVLFVSQVSPNAFEFLGVHALIGRGIAVADGAPDVTPIAVLSHKAWTTEFGAVPSIVGQSLTLDGQRRTIVGVMPPRFTWHVADVWIPRTVKRGDADAETRQFWFQARLKRGITIEQAAAQLDVIASRRVAHHPADYPKQFRMSVVTVIDWVVGRFRGVLYTLFGAVGLLLVIACCNVANMLMARATVRQREFTLRGALGASRSRLTTQLMIESVLLALAGAVAGVLLAYGGIKAVAYFLPRQGVAYEVELRLDRWALLFSLATAIGTSLVFGLLPAWQGARRNLVEGLKDGGKGVATGSHGWLRNALVVGEVGLSLVLLLGAGMLMRSFLTMMQVDLGFSPHGIAIADVWFPEGTYQSAADRERYYENAVTRLAAVPGVLDASYASNNPLGGIRTPVERPGLGSATERDGRLVLCGSDYLQLLGLKTIRGRALESSDVTGVRHVAVINRTLARQFFGAEDPIGQPIRFSLLASTPEIRIDPVFEIIGIVPDVRNRGVLDADPIAYVPSSVTGVGSRLIVVRTAGDPELMIETIARTLRGVDRSVPVMEVDTFTSNLSRRYAQPRFSVIVLTTFAAVGLMLVAVGVYGVMSYVVSHRRRDIAIRMALGAGQRAMLADVMRSSALLLAIGIAVGLPVSIGTQRLLTVDPAAPATYDPWIATLGVAVIMAVGMLACLVPALRAARVDPMRALREE